MEYFTLPSSKPCIDQAIKDISFSLRSGPVNTNNRSHKTSEEKSIAEHQQRNVKLKVPINRSGR